MLLAVEDGSTNYDYLCNCILFRLKPFLFDERERERGGGRIYREGIENDLIDRFTFNDL